MLRGNWLLNLMLFVSVIPITMEKHEVLLICGKQPCHVSELLCVIKRSLLLQQVVGHLVMT